MRLKIVSDGTPMGTRVMTLDGQEIEDVNMVAWSITKHSLANATIGLENVPAELKAQTEIKKP